MSSNTLYGYYPKLCALRDEHGQVTVKDLIWTDALTESVVRDHGQCKGLFSSLPEAWVTLQLRPT